MPILMQLSDLHFGPSYIPELGDAILEDIKTIQPDVVVVSGDLTLRARHEEYEHAKEYLARFARPMLTIPGNHDQAIFNPLERLLTPVARYQKHIDSRVDSTLQAGGFFIVGLNDNRPILPGGFWSRGQREWVKREFTRAPSDGARVVATHHQMLWDGKWQPAGFWNSKATLEFLAGCGVELVLNGHTHIPDVTRTLEGIVVCRASTATCARTRHGQGNSYNLISVNEKEISVRIHRYDPQAKGFGAAEAFTFPRSKRKVN